MRRWILGLIVVLLPVPALAADRADLTLRAGRAGFISGPHTEQASTTSCEKGSCWSYSIDVAERGYRLRIGIDRPEVGDVYRADIFDPDGDRVGSISPEADLYSAEFIEEDPLTGTWRVEVRAEEVTDSAFRLRAKLEARAPSLGTKKGAVPPNLQVLPPHEASFLTPVSNGLASGDPIGVDSMGAESCHPEEHAEEQAIRCLRFAFGIRNTGLGPLQLTTSGSDPQERDLIQRVMRANDTSFERPAGVARFHKTHGHWHHHDAVALKLYSVADRASGKLETASDKHFKGFAHRDELLRDWDRFYPTWAKYGIGLLPGWSDIYEWDRPGNYIEFGLNGDGYYVVRMWADPVRGVLESNEKDNVGYTYLKVEGSKVELLESGRGRDPWDPCKIEVGFGGHPDPEPRQARPSRCPRDTT